MLFTKSGHLDWYRLKSKRLPFSSNPCAKIDSESEEEREKKIHAARMMINGLLTLIPIWQGVA